MGKSSKTSADSVTPVVSDASRPGRLRTVNSLWRRHRWLRWSVYGLALGLVAWSLWLLYNHPPGPDSLWPSCFFQRHTGLYCPGCGNTRALYALLHGDLATTFSRNALFVPTLILLPFLLGSKKVRHSPLVGWSVAIAYILFAILRNLPWYPCTLLAP